MIMEKRVLSNGVEIPAIGLGVYLSPEGQANGRFGALGSGSGIPSY